MANQQLDQRITVGVFSGLANAQAAVERLLKARFTKDQITIMCSDKAVERRFDDALTQEPQSLTTPSAAATGGAVGAGLGVLTVAAGLVTAGGAAVLLAGAMAAGFGTVVGGFVGAMMNRGLQKELADYYDQAVTRGKILVAVEDQTDNWQASMPEAERILQEAGAEPVSLPEG